MVKKIEYNDIRLYVKITIFKWIIYKFKTIIIIFIIKIILILKNIKLSSWLYWLTSSNL